MSSIRNRNGIALSILAGALLTAMGAAGKSTDTTSTDPQSAALASPNSAAVANPSSPAPAFTPPAAPEKQAPPGDAAQSLAPPSSDPAPPPPATPSAPGGQWVYTSQYGWIWMPYAANYTFVSSDGGTAYMYVYYPAYGWRWVFSPWVFGWGPRPVWGALGPARFAWYAHPWFRVGVIHREPLHARFWHRR